MNSIKYRKACFQFECELTCYRYAFTVPTITPINEDRQLRHPISLSLLGVEASPPGIPPITTFPSQPASSLFTESGCHQRGITKWYRYGDFSLIVINNEIRGEVTTSDFQQQSIKKVSSHPEEYCPASPSNHIRNTAEASLPLHQSRLEAFLKRNTSLTPQYHLTTCKPSYKTAIPLTSKSTQTHIDVSTSKMFLSFLVPVERPTRHTRTLSQTYMSSPQPCTCSCDCSAKHHNSRPSSPSWSPSSSPRWLSYSNSQKMK